MRFFDRFKNKSPVKTRYELIVEDGNGFFVWDDKLYKSDIIRACIKPKVKALGKLVPKHVRETESGIKLNPDPNLKFMLEQPNPYMSSQMLIEKMSAQLILNGNAFAYINRDEFGYATEIYPISASSVEAKYDGTGLLYLKFLSKNGKQLLYPYSNIIHLRDDFNDNEVFGTRPHEALKSLMEIVTTTDQGIVKAIKNSNVIRWLLKFNQALRPEDIDGHVESFMKHYLSVDGNTYGVAATDTKADAQQVEPKDYVPNAAQMDKTTQRIYSFFHTNENILQSKYSEDDWISYYESEIEPIAIQFGNEYTNKIFSRHLRAFGNKIVFETSNLQYASLKTKLDLVSMVDRGALTPNEWRATLGLPPIEGGDKPIRRLDTEEVKGNEENKKVQR